MNYKGIIFDLDGTLIDSVGDICAFANQALENYGYPTHTKDKYIEWIGDGARKLMQRALPEDIDAETFEKLFADYLKIYELDEHVQSVLYDGIPELLDKLNESGVPIAMLTNKPHAVMLKTLESYFSKWNFEITIGLQEGRPKKPDPDEAIFIANQLNIKPQDLIFIGDSVVDVQTGQAAGMSTICIAAGYEDRAALVAAKATVLIEKHDELLSILNY